MTNFHSRFLIPQILRPSPRYYNSYMFAVCCLLFAAQPSPCQGTFFAWTTVSFRPRRTTTAGPSGRRVALSLISSCTPFFASRPRVSAAWDTWTARRNGHRAKIVGIYLELTGRF